MSGRFVNYEQLRQLATRLSGTNTTPDSQAETLAYRHKAEIAKLEIERLSDENKSRKVFSEHIFVVTVIWMFLILGVVISAGCGSLKLSDTVLVTLITTTTANVFGFLYVVVNYLFNKDKST